MLPLFGSAQQLDLRSESPAEDLWSFRPEFISRNEITAIQVELEEKKSNQAIRSTGKTTRYTFTDAGTLDAVSTFRTLFGRRDTILERFGLSENDRLALYERNDRRGVYQERFIYAGDSVHIRRFRGEEAQDQLAYVSSEFKVRTTTATGFKRTTYNEDGLPYLEEAFTYEDGYLKQISERYVVSKRTTVTRLHYNEVGRLHYVKQEDGNTSLEWSYEYTDDGLLKRSYHRKNGKAVWKRELLHMSSGFISAIVTKDEKSEDIQIERFTYEFED